MYPVRGLAPPRPVSLVSRLGLSERRSSAAPPHADPEPRPMGRPCRVQGPRWARWTCGGCCHDRRSVRGMLTRRASAQARVPLSCRAVCRCAGPVATRGFRQGTSCSSRTRSARRSGARATAQCQAGSTEIVGSSFRVAMGADRYVTRVERTNDYSAFCCVRLLQERLSASYVP